MRRLSRKQLAAIWLKASGRYRGSYNYQTPDELAELQFKPNKKPVLLGILGHEKLVQINVGTPSGQVKFGVNPAKELMMYTPISRSVRLVWTTGTGEIINEKTLGPDLYGVTPEGMVVRKDPKSGIVQIIVADKPESEATPVENEKAIE